MHVLIIPSWYHSPFNRIRGVFFKDQALAVAEKVDKVGVVAPVLISVKEVIKTKLFSFQQEQLTIDNISEHIQPILAFPFWKRFNHFLQYRIGKKMLKKYIFENGVPDVVHLQSALVGKLAIWLLKEYQIPFIVTEHSSAFQSKQLSSSELAVAQEVFSLSKVNIAVSEALAHDLTALFNRNFTVIPNIVDTDYFIPSTQKTEKFTFLNVAHLNPNKNHQLLVKAFAELVKQKDARLVIAGAGEERKNLEQLIKSLGLEKKVSLFGIATRKEVRMLMQQANCFVLSSKLETFGVVLIEAMACGIPVVSTKCGGPNKIVEEETGILCSFTVSGMSESMLDMMRKDMDGQLIRKKVVERYSKHSVSEKIIDNYHLCTK
tara:strand:+ start:2259 stop:3386 length:1128 start_codon:yes stop_codon:yes gene_type:complete